MSDPIRVAEISTELNTALNAQPLGLYDLAGSLSLIDQYLEEADGVLTPEIEAALESLQGAFTTKVDYVCLLRQNALAEADMCADESKRLKKRADSANRKAESLRQFLHGAFIKAGETKIRTARWTVYIQSSPASIRWTRRVDELPPDYRRIKIEPNIERAHLDMKAGQDLPDGFVIEHSTHLRIK